jgi:outer membrane protein TolC
VKVLIAILIVIFLLANISAFGQRTDSSSPRVVRLEEAVALAMKNNHVVRLAALQVEQKQHAKDVARSAYFPLIRNDSTAVRVTDTQFIEIPAGALGVAGSGLIPSQPVVLNQGGHSFETSGTGLIQPLSQLWKIKAGNDVTRAELDATRGKSHAAENQIALTVHQIYYKILIVEQRRSALQAKIEASSALQSERTQQVQYGALLETELIESRAQALQAKQEMLTVELQISDLHMQFNDVIGLPLMTQVSLDPNVPPPSPGCARDDCVRVARESHPEIEEARALVEKASAGVRLAKREYLPDVEAFARYSYQNNVPFLARNFGTLGVHFSYDIFDGGKKRATLRERETQLAQAKENLARINDEVEFKVQADFNKLDRTREMVAVSEELLTLRKESRRVAAEHLVRGVALRSQAQSAVAQELEARTLLLQSQLDYLQATDEMTEAIGRAPQ